MEDGVCQGVCTPCGTQCCTAGESCYGPFLTNAEPVCCANGSSLSGLSVGRRHDSLCQSLIVGHHVRCPTCNTDADCSGEICIQTPGCPGGGNKCAPAC